MIPYNDCQRSSDLTLTKNSVSKYLKSLCLFHSKKWRNLNAIIESIRYLIIESESFLIKRTTYKLTTADKIEV